MQSAREIAESYWSAEANRDIDLVMSHYHPQARFRAPGWDLVGHSEIRRYYESSAAEYPALEVQIVSELTVDRETALEWEAVLITSQGTRHPLNGINRMTLEDGLFLDVRAYFDPAQLGGSARA